MFLVMVLVIGSLVFGFVVIFDCECKVCVVEVRVGVINWFFIEEFFGVVCFEVVFGCDLIVVDVVINVE